jgi:hypothetical protein
MESQETCPYCKEEMHGGMYKKNYTVCYVCKAKVCSNCSKYGFCLEHYNGLPDDHKKKIKSNETLFLILGIILPVITPFIILLIFMSNIDFAATISPTNLRIYGIILILFLFIYFFMMLSLKNKRTQKIVEDMKLN